LKLKFIHIIFVTEDGLKFYLVGACIILLLHTSLEVHKGIPSLDLACYIVLK